MCGIHLRAWKDSSCEFCHAVFSQLPNNTNNSSDASAACLEDDSSYKNLRRRGPESYSKFSLDQHMASGSGNNNQWYHQMDLHASVLKMRHALQEQPVQFQPRWKKANENNTADDNDETSEPEFAYLCWNGEIYQLLSYPEEASEDVWDYETADTLQVARLLEELIPPDNHSEIFNSPQHYIAEIMARLYNAEFAFLVWTKDGVHFGRDPWGRRSLLLWSCPRGCGSFQVVSVVEQAIGTVNNDDGELFPLLSTLEWSELSPGKVHSILFSELGGPMVSSVDYPKLPIGFSQRFDTSFWKWHHPTLPEPSMTAMSYDISDRLWRASLEFEFHLRRAILMRLDQSSSCSTGILFSGGVDSVVVAALAANVLFSHSTSSATTNTTTIPTLHLYNVSFGPQPEKSADRAAAIKSYEALKEQYQSSALEIIFYDIVVEWEDICRVERHIRTLLLPKATVMDVNIATALWFASGGGKGGVRPTHDDNRPPRVLLLGMGADEQLGGYGRHRKAFELGGWSKLQEELLMDQDRLWERNLGRDDRLCSDHGREARFPFLDAHVVQFLRQTQLVDICNYDLPPGQGDKQILRLVAERLGMSHASGLIKRAIQFGSRISHLSDTKRFGSRRKAKGEMNIE
jgi:asparagine synthetase B (glutamine-hydrolysing)